MKAGDLVMIREDSFSAKGFHEVFHRTAMIITNILTIAGPDGCDIYSVIEVMGPTGLSRFEKDVLEVLPEVIEDEIQYMSMGFVD